METRANYLWVGAVTLALLVGLAVFIVWLSNLTSEQDKSYDIFFKQEVSGLANGSQVSFAGVPVGQVEDITLWDQDPEFVRVRVRVDQDVPILVGTTATIQGSFTGVSTILLDGARAGAPPISCGQQGFETACPEGVPVIPTKPGGLGAILSSAPVLLERLATLTERLSSLLDDRNQGEIAGILENTNEITRGFAASAPQLEGTLRELQVTLREAGGALDAFEQVTRSTDVVINQEGTALAAELRTTLGEAGQAAAALSRVLDDARPATRRLNEQTLPAAEETIRDASATLEDLRATSKALRELTERVERDGATSLLGSQPLPDYEP